MVAAVARLERVDGPVRIEREDAARYVTIRANVRGRDLVGFVEEAQALLGYQLWSSVHEKGAVVA